MKALTDTYYHYDRAKGRCADLKLVWSRDIESQADQVFARLGLTQAQVDELSVLQCHVIKWLFSPRAYDWRGRIALALHFLFGRH